MREGVLVVEKLKHTVQYSINMFPGIIKNKYIKIQKFHRWGIGVMVAREIPNLKVSGSIPLFLRFFFPFAVFLLSFLSLSRTFTVW